MYDIATDLLRSPIDILLLTSTSEARPSDISPAREVEIVGEPVGNLDHEDGGGSVVVRTIIALSADQPRCRDIRIDLGATDYELALRVHAGRHDVLAIGDLQVSGRPQLGNVTRFEILSDPEPDETP